MISEGDKAPNFSLEADDGTIVSRDSLAGQNVIVFFYPKDNTSGCTREACDFRDAFPRFGKVDAVVVGISPDSLESHRKFKTQYELPYRLLSDEGHKVADAFGVWKEKSMYGRKYMGIERTTVIIDRKGRVARIFPKVKVPGHVQEVEKALDALG
ncbi:MAG: thioredoxin-dependent thiol peroxidase [Gemmatimonadota bacterium]|nr:thioredoxin-dependent thiol peroxidase [Gemmatimonadota bacterium]